MDHSNIYSLCSELMIYISYFLNDKSKMSFFMTCTETYKLREHVTYTNCYDFNKIRDLTFYHKFIRVRNVPSTKFINKYMTYISFSDSFNEDIIGCLPDSLIYLKFGNKFNKPLLRILNEDNNQLDNDGIKESNVLEKIYQSLLDDEQFKLSNNIYYCLLNHKQVELALGPNIKYLHFGSNFNQNIIGCLPNSIQELYFGFNFNQALKKYKKGMKDNSIVITAIPFGIKNLCFGKNFNQDISECIPDTIKYLQIPEEYQGDLMGVLPISINRLEIPSRCVDQYVIPETIKYLKITGILGMEKLQYVPVSVTDLSIELINNDNNFLSFLLNENFKNVKTINLKSYQFINCIVPPNIKNMTIFTGPGIFNKYHNIKLSSPDTKIYIN
ncbi:FNIP repeat-containing protein [Moumouvirus australiensis]|uniref:FNIP repeat-containing protein n=1 Tax=Moumouvirus australiensis TaxID=2109587 RepID=A0A2P1EL08_9VIRU|nr:FNIP repeat-containing protein [Moumouvirus australiensis]AVL94557.1 FNIP repeat-containing protein [Moumouvirus australiensis]